MSRVDLWLFQARLCKSRTQATNACKEGKVYRGDRKLDPSDEVKPGDLIDIRERGLYKSYRILEMPGKNVSKELAHTTWRDETAQEIIDRFAAMREADKLRRDTVKPDKRERRQINKLRNR